MYRAPPQNSPLLVVASSSSVVAYHRRSGQQAWSFEVPSANEARGARVWVEGDHVFVVAMSPPRSKWTGDSLSVVSCLDYQRGTLRWQQSLDEGNYWGMATLLADGDEVFLASRRNLMALSITDGAVLWTRPLKESTWANAGLALPGLVVQGDITE